MTKLRLAIQVLGITAVLASVGCTDPNTAWKTPDVNPAPADPFMKQAQSFKAPSEAGVRVDPAPAVLWTQLVRSRTFSSRPDPFALQPKERAFETSQEGERMFTQIGGWDVRFEPVDEIVVQPTVEPQPYRRLAGVIVGDSILALIDMGNGQLTLIHPGSDVEGWHVDSINGDFAVLTRTGNLLPRKIIVRLEEPKPGGANTNGNQGMGNNPGNGFPGPPPGVPGGPGSGFPGGRQGGGGAGQAG